MNEVRGVLADAVGSDGRDVLLLVADVDARAGHAPVAMAAGPALLVEVEIVFVAGVAGVAGPDLQTGAWIAREDGDGVGLVVGAFDVEGVIEAAIVRRVEAGVLICGAAQEFVRRVDARRLLHEMRIDEEELERGFAERLLDADAREAGRLGGAFRSDGVGPEAGGAIAAFRRPDAARAAAEMFLVRGDGDAHLRAQALVCAEQRHVAVRGGAGDDLDDAAIGEAAEAARRCPG